MRFWGKSKYGEKKPSKEKLIGGADSFDGDSGDTGPLLGDSKMLLQNVFELKVV